MKVVMKILAFALALGMVPSAVYAQAKAKKETFVSRLPVFVIGNNPARPIPSDAQMGAVLERERLALAQQRGVSSDDIVLLKLPANLNAEVHEGPLNGGRWILAVLRAGELVFVDRTNNEIVQVARCANPVRNTFWCCEGGKPCAAPLVTAQAAPTQVSQGTWPKEASGGAPWIIIKAPFVRNWTTNGDRNF